MKKNTETDVTKDSERVVMKSTKSGKRRSRYMNDLRVPFIVCTIEAIVLMAAFAVIGFVFRSVDTTDPLKKIMFVGLGEFAFYILTAVPLLIFYIVRSRRVANAFRESEAFSTDIYDIFRFTVDQPYAVMNIEGRVKVVNAALQDILDLNSPVCDVALTDFCDLDIKKLTANARNSDYFKAHDLYAIPEKREIEGTLITRLSNGRRYNAVSYIFLHNGESYYFVVFEDVSEYLDLREKTESEAPVVAYIMLDNLQELTQYVRANYSEAVVEIEKLIREWVEELNGFISEYDKDKYVAVFTNKALENCISQNFPILEKVMRVNIGDNSFPVSLSIGISAIEGSMKERESAAASALDIALQRGGNQVVLRQKGIDGLRYFGGAHKTMESNTSITARVSSKILESAINKASNILIMGHSNPDFDSIGSCVGVYSFVCAVLGKSVHEMSLVNPKPIRIIANTDSATIASVVSYLNNGDDYEGVFIDSQSCLAKCSENTLLIITDVNNPYIFECPEIVGRVRNIAIIDHHRLVNELPFETVLRFIDATKSSASEIVSEIISQSDYSDRLEKREATALLAGIMLDTNNYLRNAGKQTFAITEYLYTHGAHTGVAREFFNESLDDMLISSDFESMARIYRGVIAVSWLTGNREANPSDRVAAAKAADKLLGIRGIEASFTLVKMGDSVVISGRSKGEINVQIILEKLEGGGHFDMAGAQIANTGISGACELLKGAIDDYFEYDYRGKLNTSSKKAKL